MNNASVRVYRPIDEVETNWKGWKIMIFLHVSACCAHVGAWMSKKTKHFQMFASFIYLSPLLMPCNFIVRVFAHVKNRKWNALYVRIFISLLMQQQQQKRNVLCSNFNEIFFRYFFFFVCRILDSMKVPGQRSSFHICDILDLNTTDSKNTNNNNNNNTTNNNSNENANTNTSFASHTNTTSTSSRDDGASTITVQPPPPIPPPPYQLPASFNSAIYSELGHHYHSMFPAATKTWLKEHHEHYGKSTHTHYAIEICAINIAQKISIGHWKIIRENVIFRRTS